ncbi:peptidoglycan-binding protein LysM [Frigoriflavimonas asaccharolytica]|uniref:Potassium binding protein Kbp n=1 Tax=Frigoriflavimonas asaccharolytica TaxID=2735899 RepID=A0A8J8G5J2_9FLAO|nr:peptidoglycan-binding protein LysM [Frigoriflavimonas asaccharolytica]NRS91858.1 nucleoid-associated protein YgaU [Frigoriflavimonas asaccharolytica]
MGLGSFLKNVGSKIFGGGETAEEQAQKVRDHVAKFGFDVSGLTFTVADDKVTIAGNAKNWEEKNKIYVAAGNVEGIEEVTDNMTVAVQEAEVQVADIVVPMIRFHAVESGDTLSKIAKEAYGDANEYHKIFEANQPMLTSPDKIYPGQVLILP